MPATLVNRIRGTVFVTDNLFSLGDPDDPNSPLYNPGTLPTPDITGLLATAPGFVAVTCGVHVGTVSVTVETWDGAPDVNVDPWNDVAEVSVVWLAEQIIVFGDTSDPSVSLAVALPAAPDGSFRIRGSVRNRDAGEDRTESDPVEEHLIQIWPAPTANAELIKGTDAVGAMWRIAEQ